jgi:hypothetical protein
VALLCAAPDLLAALEHLLGSYCADVEIAPGMSVKTSFETNSRAIDSARSAIAKARAL